MRKFLLLLLLTALGLPLASPVLISIGRSAMSVPACCRRSDRHHRTRNPERTSATGEFRLNSPTEQCPFVLRPFAPSHREASGPSQFVELVVSDRKRPCDPPYAEPLWLMSRDRSSFKRGPPSLTLPKRSPQIIPGGRTPVSNRLVSCVVVHRDYAPRRSATRPTPAGLVC